MLRRPSTRAALVVLAALACLGTATPPATAASPAGGPHTARLSSVWLPWWDAAAGLASVRAAADVVSTVSPFWYRAGSCTSLVEPGGTSPALVAELRARGIAVVPTVSSTLLPQEAVDCLGDPARRRAHVEQLVRVATVPGHTGLDLNYESLALTTDLGVADRVRGAFTAFVQETCAALRAVDRTCVVTVMPRTDDAPAVWRGKLVPAVYDYAALGAAADLVRVMAYDEHAPNTPAGPIAGYPWVEAVAAYAASRVPPARVELGIPMYGRDWARGTATVVRSSDAPALAARHGRPVEWDPVQRAPRFSYTSAGTPHEVWFNDARAVAERLALARRHGFRAALWAAGQEDPATWQAVRDGSRVVFTDVYGTVHEPGALAVAAAGVAGGFPDGSFRPGGPVTRGQLATVLTRALRLPDPGAPATHTDVASSPHASGIAAVTAAGLAGGFADGTFRPDEPVSRGQLATLLTRGWELQVTVSAPYADRDLVHGYGIAAVTEAGWVGGYADMTFRSGDPVSRGQLATVLARALRLPTG